MLKNRLIIDLLCRVPGLGVSDSFALPHGYSVVRGIQEIIKAKKDIYPMRLFQYGAIKFAANTEKSGSVFVYGQAIEGYDAISLEVKMSK